MDNKIKYLTLTSAVIVSLIMISIMMMPNSNAQTTYYANQTINPSAMKLHYYPSISGIISGQTYTIHVVQPVTPYVPANLYNDWATFSTVFKEHTGAGAVNQYHCMAPDLTGQNQGYVDDNSQAGFVNRTYLYQNQDFSTHCDITTTQEKSFQANNILQLDNTIHQLPPQFFRIYPTGSTAQELLHQKLMFVTDLIYQNKYDMALTQLADLKATIHGDNPNMASPIIDTDAQKILLPRVDDLMLQTILVSSPGSQLPSVTTSSVPEYGPIAVLVLAIAIISIIGFSTKTNLKFTI
ncbi:MAG TPA: PEFG-CTERM sorting domain-containing protein [Nitrosopumilaceae archaeon]|nr:PEFG-CTERM sorting domain-containing protein [Nitrosopumilaceae archaeon]